MKAGRSHRDRDLVGTASAGRRQEPPRTADPHPAGLDTRPTHVINWSRLCSSRSFRTGCKLTRWFHASCLTPVAPIYLLSIKQTIHVTAPLPMHTRDARRTRCAQRAWLSSLLFPSPTTLLPATYKVGCPSRQRSWLCDMLDRAVPRNVEVYESMAADNTHGTHALGNCWHVHVHR